MKFLLEDTYPRVWCRFNGETSKRTSPATTFEEYIRPRYWVNTKPMVPQYTGRAPRAHEIQDKLLAALRAEPKSMRTLTRELGKTPASIASAIKALREKGHVIECAARTYFLIT